jgi:GTP-binding protein Era|tara:strand:- start:134 stop:997 length:864 start_codon:yes stop_codon:yes gene_type:complete
MMPEKKSGYVAIIGRPNVGKSTLINALIGEKVTIVTSKPQTTVQNIIGILNDDDSQIILVDTPGLVSNKQIASQKKTYNRSVVDALASSDVIVMLSEANKWTKTDEQLLDQIKKQSLPSIHVVNKVDRFKDKTKILDFLKNHSYLDVFSDVIPVSAKYQKNLDSLLSVIKDHLPHNDLDYDEKSSTDQDLYFRISEALRERLMENLKDELPYKFDCVIETVEDKGKVFLIEIAILVNKQAHKKIIIGKQGQLLKKIGSEARGEIEKILNRQVYLSTYIKVVKPGRRK